MSVLVLNAIAQLKEIEDAMKLDPSTFKLDDIENCDKLATLLHELVIFLTQIHSTPKYEF